MNYLCHLYFSEADPLARLGNLAGDFVKGRIDERWPPALARGLALHRRFDAFAQHNPAFNASRARLGPAVGRYRGVLVDICYDHFLARHWEQYSAQPLAAFAASVYADLDRHAALLPEGLRRIAPRMRAHDWLVSYRDADIVGLVLERMADRLPRHGALAAGGAEFVRHEVELYHDFMAFMAAAREWLWATERILPCGEVGGAPICPVD